MKKILLLVVVITTNLGFSQEFWTEVAPFENTNYIPNFISIVNEDIVWVNGNTNNFNEGNKWAKSNDGGISWIFGEYNIPNSIIGSIHSISNTVAYATSFPNNFSNPNPTGINGVWKTVDGGATWTQQTSAAFNNINSFVNTIHFWNENDGIVLGDPINNSFEIYTTQNGGTNWTLVPSSNIPTPLQEEVGYVLNFDAKGNSVWFGTNRGRIFRSTNQGVNWSVSQSPLVDFGGQNNGNFTFKNENEGLLITSIWQQYRTLDGGLSWNNEAYSPNLRNYKTISIPETTNAYFQFGEEITLGTRGSSYSIDGGQSWIDLQLEENPVYPFTAKFLNGNIGYCIGHYTENSPADKRFFRLTDPLNRLNGSLSNEKFDLAKTTISPNPSIGLVKISGEQIIDVQITDVLGKTVLSEVYIPSNEVLINIESFQNGIYLAKIRSENGNSSTIKIIKK